MHKDREQIHRNKTGSDKHARKQAYKQRQAARQETDTELRNAINTEET